MQMHLSRSKEARLIKCDASSNANLISSIKVKRDDTWWSILAATARRAHELYMKCFEKGKDEGECMQLLRVYAEKDAATEGAAGAGQQNEKARRERTRKAKQRAKKWKASESRQ